MESENVKTTKLITTKMQLEAMIKKFQFIRYINLILKRIIDIISALVGIVLLIPITICIAILNICFGDKGPIFYTQIRIGKNGKHFKMYKFRTMCIDADKKLNNILKENDKLKKEWEENRKIEKDPRITKLGSYIRKNSIDEFPQFINVLLGNMSLVGPRPVVDGEVEKYGEFKNKILSVKPGITGCWATHGRSKVGYKKRVLLEAYYVDKFSIWLDIKIILKTIRVIFNRQGAC